MRPTSRLRRLARVWDYLMRPQPAAPKKPRRRLGFEPLEDRTVPTTVHVGASAPVVEGGDPGFVRVWRYADDTAGDVTVQLNFGGTAAYAVDYAAAPNTVFLADGQEYTDIPIEALSDGVIDPDQFVEVSLVDNGTYLIGDNYAQVHIVDDGDDSAPAADPGEPRSEFELGGVPGTVRYDIDTSQVDPDATSYEAPLTNFRLEFGGQAFTPDTPGFSAGNPVAVIADGVFQYVKYDVTFDEPVEGFSRLVADGGEEGTGEVSGEYADGAAPPEKARVLKRGPSSLTFDFAPTDLRNAQTWRVYAGLNGREPLEGSFNLPANCTPAAAAATVASALRGFDLKVTMNGPTAFVVTCNTEAGQPQPDLRTVVIWTSLPNNPKGPVIIEYSGAAQFTPHGSYLSER